MSVFLIYLIYKLNKIVITFNINIWISFKDDVLKACNKTLSILFQNSICSSLSRHKAIKLSSPCPVEFKNQTLSKCFKVFGPNSWKLANLTPISLIKNSYKFWVSGLNFAILVRLQSNFWRNEKLYCTFNSTAFWTWFQNASNLSSETFKYSIFEITCKPYQ